MNQRASQMRCVTYLLKHGWSMISFALCSVFSRFAITIVVMRYGEVRSQKARDTSLQFWIASRGRSAARKSQMCEKSSGGSVAIGGGGDIVVTLLRIFGDVGVART